MDMTTIVQLVGSLGFPIAACFAMGYYVKYITDKSTATINALTETHKEEQTAFTTALNNNTLAIQRLSDMLSSKTQ